MGRVWSDHLWQQKLNCALKDRIWAVLGGDSDPEGRGKEPGKRLKGERHVWTENDNSNDENKPSWQPPFTEHLVCACAKQYSKDYIHIVSFNTHSDPQSMNYGSQFIVEGPDILNDNSLS